MPMQMHVTKDTEMSNKILSIIVARQRITRLELAEMLGKKRITQWDIAILDWLIRSKKITVEKIEKPGGINHEFVYSPCVVTKEE